MKIVASSIFILLFLCLNLTAQNIVSYGNSHISKQELVNAFLKNNTEEHPTEKSYRDYLERYIRFRLKVKAAYDLRLDSLPGQKKELDDFRRQMEQGYLTDESSLNLLVNEAFYRSRKDIHLAHIFIGFETASSGTDKPDTVKAWKLAQAVYQQLGKGADFGELASVYSSDSSAKLNKGDIGYITLFTLPYNLENLAYSTPLGSFSTPFRSRAGYHIFKTLGERKAAGKMKVAQLVLAFPPEAADDEKLTVKQKADSIYEALVKGASFTDMVVKFSNDNNARATNGELPEFGAGTFEPAFENLIFNLEEDGQISRPILTSLGYYIIKRLYHIPVNENLLNDSAMAILRQQVRNDARIELANKAMLKKIEITTGFKKNPVPDSSILNYVKNHYLNKINMLPKGISGSTVLFSFPGRKISLADFIKYLQASRYNENGPPLQNLLTQYQEATMQDYYREHLEDFNPAFHALLKEFKEGNLLFEIMQRKVWEKASADTMGLKAFYEKSKSKYWWQPSADAIVFTCTDSSLAVNLQARLAKSIGAWKDLVLALETKVQADSGRFELAYLPVRPEQMHGAGHVTQPLYNPLDKTSSFVYFVRLYPQKQQRSFEDARGLVLNDYQGFLEENWINDLKRKYPVKINEAVFKTLTR